MKWDLELLGYGLEVGVVADDQSELGGQLTGPLPQQQVEQAMVVLRNEDRGPRVVESIRDAPVHREAIRDLRNRRLQASAIGVQLRHVELDALEELARYRIGVLIRVEDVGAVPIQDLGQRGDQAFAIGAADEQGGGLFHNSVFSR
jgi:hypothetical protein